MGKIKVNVRAEFESTPIRHLAIECPSCKNWFYGWDISKKDVRYDYELYFLDCSCPKCGFDFEGSAEVKECDSEEVYKGVLKKKEEWV